LRTEQVVELIGQNARRPAQRVVGGGLSRMLGA